MLPIMPIVQNTTNSLQFLITNNGNESLTITDAEIDSEYFGISLSLPCTIEPGDDQQFSIDITPPGTADYSSLILLHSSDPDNSQFEFTLNAVSYHGLVYVSSSASNSGDGTTTSPYKSLATAISKAESNDTIIIDSGIYDGSFTIDKALNLLGNFRYNGAGWVMVPENKTEGRPVIRNNSAAANDSTVRITASPLSSEVSLISLSINTPNASTNASTVLVDSETSPTGAINIRNCTVSNPSAYSASGSSAAIRLTNGTQSGTVSITDSIIKGGDSNNNSWGIRFYDDTDDLVLNGFGLIIRRNNIEAGRTSANWVTNAGIEVSSGNTASNYINNTSIEISGNERICGSSQNANSTDNGIYIYPKNNIDFSNFRLIIANNNLISGGVTHNSGNGTKYGICYITYNMPLSASGSEIVIQNNGMIRAHGNGSTGQPYKGMAVSISQNSSDKSVPVTIYGNRIEAEADTTATAIENGSCKSFECINNIITSRIHGSGTGSRCLLISGDAGSEAGIYNNLVYVLGTNGGTAIQDNYSSPDFVSIINNIIIVGNSSYDCVASDNGVNRFLQNNYMFSTANRFYSANGSPYTTIPYLNSVTGFSGNFSGSSPIFDSNWKLTSASANDTLKSGGIPLPGVLTDISGSSRPGSDGTYAVGPYEF